MAKFMFGVRTPNGFKLVGASLLLMLVSGCSDNRTHKEPDPDPNPHTIVPDAQGNFTGVLTAQEASANIPGFGQVDGLYLYSFKKTDGTESAPSLIPDVWALQPGDRLYYEFKNRLPCVPERPEGTKGATMSETNVHTHGLIVSPMNAPDGRYGDYVFVTVNTAEKIDGSSQDCVDDTPHHDSMHAGGHHGSMHSGDMSLTAIPYSIKVPEDHPTGLYWFHPHSHGVSQQHIARGLSGLITIGDIWDHTWIQCQLRGEGDDNPCATTEAAEKEARQRSRTNVDFIVLKDLQVERSADKPWHTVEWYDPGYCGDDEYPLLEGGSCQGRNDDNTDDGIERKWLFTVNGELLPTITIPNDTAQIFRLANVGATVTYNLELRVGDTLLPFQVLANDGAAVGQDTDSGFISEGDLVLFPSARLEIYLDRGLICATLGDACNGSDISASLEVTKWECPDGDPKSCADLWPIGKIMNIKLEGLDPAEPLQPAGAKLSHAIAELNPVDEIPIASSATCSDGSLPGALLGAGQFRTIAFWNGEINKDEYFTMMTDMTPRSEPIAFDVPDEMTDEWLAANKFDEFNHDRIDLCIAANNVETWVVHNISDEFHNFHVHQSKFSVVEVSQHGDLTRDTSPNALHDNFPIPPGAWIKIKIRFSSEVVGKFVYHCHILEHEDKGMMSVIEVLPNGG
jgi:L-ascorbate oxidase